MGGPAWAFKCPKLGCGNAKWSAGWWLTYPSRKYESRQWEGWHPIYIYEMEHKRCLNPPTRLMMTPYLGNSILSKGMTIATPLVTGDRLPPVKEIHALPRNLRGRRIKWHFWCYQFY
jgi:hypothetical protein